MIKFFRRIKRKMNEDIFLIMLGSFLCLFGVGLLIACVFLYFDTIWNVIGVLAFSAGIYIAYIHTAVLYFKR